MRLAVLGGSFFQADFVQCAIQKGLTVFVLDMNDHCYLNDKANYNFVNINFSNEFLVKKFCKENAIDFVYGPANELGNLITARLAPMIGYKYNNEKIVINTTYKNKQRKKLKDSPGIIRSPKMETFQNNINLICDKLSFPLVVKPSNSSAGRGVTGVSGIKELKLAISETEKMLKPNGKIIIEEYIDGEQLSVETLSIDGDHYIIGITKEVTGGAPLFIERCHFMSKEIHNKYYPILLDPIKDLLDIFDLQWGPCHIEIKINKGGIWLIEMASRSGGLRDRLMVNAGYPDYNALILDCYLNGEFELDKLRAPSNNALVNILIYPDDVNTIEQGKKNKTWQSDYFNNKKPKEYPQSIMDAYGYVYFKSENDLTHFSLK